MHTRQMYLNGWILLTVRALYFSSHVSVVGTHVVGIRLALLIRAVVVDQPPGVPSICILCTCRAG